MKTYFKILSSIATVVFIMTCGSSTYAQNYNSNYYGSGYGDGQPGDYYAYNQPPVNANVPANQMPVGFNDFYNQLSPYGIWVNMAPYGMVWIANVPNFRPYSTNGYWAYTTYGWTWVSNYAWGWAPFHYGRWGFHSTYGWYWVPGYIWGPAWVVWSSNSDMYGWAPLLPGMSFDFNLSMDLFPPSYWTFMPSKYMGNTNLGGYYVSSSKNTTVIKNTTIINNYGTESDRRYGMGPSISDVQKRRGGSVIQQMRVTTVQDSRSMGINNNEMRIYRPVAAPPANNSRVSNTQHGQRAYNPNPAQPRVVNAGPQSSKHIQAAQKEYKNMQTRGKTQAKR